MLKKMMFFALLCSSLFWACESSLNDISASNADAGVGGSYARFVIVGDYMYVVDDASLITFDISDAANPVEIEKQAIGERIETIFNFKDKLFVGSGEGLFIYEIMDDGLPNQLSATSYFEFDIFPCDPVVANDTYAYVTLNAKQRIDNPCGGSFEINVNLLKIYDITNPQQPQFLTEYPMFAPKGVGLDGTTLFVCDDEQGLKIFDVTDPYDLKTIKHIDTFTAFDVIPLDGLLLVVGPENVYQFDYTDLDDIQQLSSFRYKN
ncbi:MAG: hypothetical protein AAF705_15170 [Bacteroidota bacterium]